jgi:hypothetical protein
MAESYAKHLDRLEHSRHAEREATGPNYAVLPPSPPSESTATPMSIMPGEDRASVATGGRNREASTAALVMYYRWPRLASLHWFAFAIREYVP